MIVKRNEIIEKEHIDFIYDFTGELNVQSQDLIELKKAKARVIIDHISDLIEVKIMLEGEMILKSTRSFKPVLFNFDDEDEITYSLIKEDEENDIIYFEGDELDLNPLIESMIITSIPLKIVDKDDEWIKGDNFEVISEDEYNARQNNKTDPRFDKLKDLFDEED